MWFWLLFLALTSLVAVFYRAACIIIPTVRTYILWGETSKWTDIAKICKDGRVWSDFSNILVLTSPPSTETGSCWGRSTRMLTRRLLETFCCFWAPRWGTWAHPHSPGNAGGSMRVKIHPVIPRFSTLLVRATSGWLRSQDSVSSCTSGIAERKGFHTDPSI